MTFWSKANLLTGLLILSRVTTATAYFNTGTIIVVAQTKQRIIIAADSRRGVTIDGSTIQTFDDNACKIAAFSGNVTFAAAGVLGDGYSWSAIGQAVDILKNSVKGRISSADGEVILIKWAQAMIQKFSNFSSNQLSVYAANNGNRISIGVLAGVEESKKPWARAVIVNFSSAGLYHDAYELISRDPPTAYYFLGKSAIGLEFVGDKRSGRAMKELKSWEHRSLSGASLDRFKARRLVELTIMYNPDKSEVGGPVDQIEVDAKGLRWLRLKPGCPEVYL